MEEVLYHLPKFFSAGSVSHTFYDLYFTEEELVVAFMGDTYRAYFVRANDPGYNRREEYKELTIEEIKKNHDKNLLFSAKKIKEIHCKRGSFFKNPNITIKTSDGDLCLYSKNKNIPFEELNKSIPTNYHLKID